MIQLVVFIVLIFLSVTSLVGILVLSAYCMIAQIRKKKSPKRLTSLKKWFYYTGQNVLNINS